MNSFPPIKAELIAGLDEQRAVSREYIEGLSPSLIVHADSGWNVKDVIVHLMAIEADSVVALQRATDEQAFQVDLRGQASVNDLYELRRAEAADRSWQAILDEWERVRDQLRGLLMAFPVDKIDMTFDTPFFQTYNLVQAIRACGVHERHHINEIRAAADQQDP